MGQCACKEAAIEVDKDIIVECPPPSGSSASSDTTDVDKAPGGCYNSSSAESTQSSSSLTQLDLGALPGADVRRRSLLLRGGGPVPRRHSGASSASALGKDSLSTVDSFDGGCSEASVSFSSISEAPRFADPAAAALLEASARRLANSTPTPVVGSDQIVERLRNLERKIPTTRNSGRGDASQVSVRQQSQRRGPPQPRRTAHAFHQSYI